MVTFSILPTRKVPGCCRSVYSILHCDLSSKICNTYFQFKPHLLRTHLPSLEAAMRNVSSSRVGCLDTKCVCHSIPFRSSFPLLLFFYFLFPDFVLSLLSLSPSPSLPPLSPYLPPSLSPSLPPSLPPSFPPSPPFLPPSLPLSLPLSLPFVHFLPSIALTELLPGIFNQLVGVGVSCVSCVYTS